MVIMQCVILRDLNGRIGQERAGIEHKVGAFSVGDKNPSGEIVIDSCVNNNLSIMNTL